MSHVSIQITATVINGAGAQAVPFGHPGATNLSVYLRNSDGTAAWVGDFPPGAFDRALVHAAKLSIKHGIYIETVTGLEQLTDGL